jgi:hypothetical protein
VPFATFDCLPPRLGRIRYPRVAARKAALVVSGALSSLMGIGKLCAATQGLSARRGSRGGQFARCRLRGHVAANLNAEVFDGTLAWLALCVTVYRSTPPNSSESGKSPCTVCNAPIARLIFTADEQPREPIIVSGR